MSHEGRKGELGAEELNRSSELIVAMKEDRRAEKGVLRLSSKERVGGGKRLVDPPTQKNQFCPGCLSCCCCFWS